MVIRPPQYFPTLPFWAEFFHFDDFALSDEFQYSRQSFQNRSRLRTPDGWQWITVPVKGGQHGRPIKDMEIDNSARWWGKHLRALQYNYRTSPFFEAFEDRLCDFFSQDWITLGELNIASIRLVCDMLRVDPPTLSSASDLVEADPGLIFSPPTYRQNFEGFESGMSVLDAFFNLGYDTERLIRDATETGSGRRNDQGLTALI